MASGRILVTQAFSCPASRICMLSLSLRLSARHSYTLPGSCFEKNDKTLFHALRLMLTHLRFRALHNFRALPVCYHLVSDLFHSHTMGSFQLSLALLVRYRSVANI